MSMAGGNLGNLGDHIRQLSRTPNLLVACDYDGTLAPLVDDPMDARPNRDSVAALRQLAELSNTHVAVISGRSLRDLATLSRFPEEIRLVGSHGSEFELGFASKLNPDLIRLRTQITQAISELAEKYGAISEEKPTGVTFHTRNFDEETAARAMSEIHEKLATFEGIHTRTGHNVIEMSVIDTNKGTAIETIRSQVGASAVLFIGDDVTDEDGFAVLAGPDMGIKVGPAATAAQFRVASTDTVAEILALVAELRGNWLRGAGLIPIENHSVLSDLRTVAVLAPDTNVTWMCAPRIDSASIFAELLGGPTAGHFRIKPADDSQPLSQRYISNTMHTKTEFENFSVTDFLDVSSGRTRRMAGRSDLVRTIEGIGEIQIDFAPRINFGRSPTLLEVKDDGIVVSGGADLMVLRSEGVSWEIIKDGVHETAHGTATLGEDPLVLELRCGSGTLKPAAKLAIDRQTDSEEYWSNWIAKLTLPSLEQERVARSALVLKSLCHGPTGAILAAATTSLPEHLGGVRNWDYRYCWLRDAALTAASLVRLGSNGEAMSYLDWVLRILETGKEPERLSPLYNVTGHHLPPEAEIAELPGYGSSRPVRIGNAADGQVQLDVFGPIVDLVYVLLRSGEELSTEHWRLVEAMVLAVSRRWKEPDHGIWEIRKPARHHVYTKVMCWVTVDRAIAIAREFLDREPKAWITLREEIADDVLSNGWKTELNSFSAAYDGVDLDASVLAIGMWGLVDPKDPRFVSTVEAVAKGLQDGPTVYRYLDDDGLPGKEGGFHLMTTWLIESLALIGRTADANNLFREFCDLTGATGLLSEEYDPESGQALGNLPQAYSHLGLINNAILLEQLS